MLISETCECYHIWQKGFASVIKLRLLQGGDYPELSGWANLNYMKSRDLSLTTGRRETAGEITEMHNLFVSGPMHTSY